MKKIMVRKLILNKRNKQLNLSIPKKKLPPELAKKFKFKGIPKRIRIKIEGFEW